MENKASNKQKTLIHLAISQLGISRTDYETILSEYWVKSSVDLSFKDAERLINRFIAKGFVIKKKARKKLPPNITQLPSPQILAHIEHLRKDVKWIVYDGYFRLIKKRFGFERPRTMAEAQKIVEMLKSMLARQQRASQPEAECYKDGHIRGKGYYRW